MVQGASRGIGLEFVRFFSYLHINIAYLGTAHIVKIFMLVSLFFLVPCYTEYPSALRMINTFSFYDSSC